MQALISALRSMAWQLACGALVVGLLWLAAYAVGVVGQRELERNRAEQALRQLETRTRELTVCQGDAARLRAAVERQNAAMAEWRRAADARLRLVQRQRDAAKRDAEAHRRRAERILRTPASGEECRAASALIRETLEEERR